MSFSTDYAGFNEQLRWILDIDAGSDIEIEKECQESILAKLCPLDEQSTSAYYKVTFVASASWHNLEKDLNKLESAKPRKRIVVLQWVKKWLDLIAELRTNDYIRRGLSDRDISVYSNGTHSHNQIASKEIAQKVKLAVAQQLVKVFIEKIHLQPLDGTTQKISRADLLSHQQKQLESKITQMRQELDKDLKSIELRANSECKRILMFMSTKWSQLKSFYDNPQFSMDQVSLCANVELSTYDSAYGTNQKSLKTTYAEFYVKVGDSVRLINPITKISHINSDGDNELGSQLADDELVLKCQKILMSVVKQIQRQQPANLCNLL